MSAQLLFLPAIRRSEQGDETGELVQFKLGRIDMARLKNRAAEWGMTEAEAALAIVSEALKPRRRE